MTEVWKDIPGFENLYKISNLGTVLNIISNKERKVSVNYKGYKVFTLWNKGQSKGFQLHRILALLFIPNPGNKPTVNHIDGNKLNNKLSNLEWATHKEQHDHAINNSLYEKAKGEQIHSSILNENDVIEVIDLLKKGKTLKNIANKFNVSIGAIASIRQKRNWKYLSNSLELKNPSDKKQIIDQYGNVYQSLTEAAKRLDLQISKISLVLKKKRNHTGGYKFYYYKGDQK